MKVSHICKYAIPCVTLLLTSCHVIWSDFSNPHDINNMTIRTYAGVGGPTGSFSGDGGPAASAGLSNPVSIAFDSADNLYISDSGNGRVREVSASTGIITTVAGGGTGVVANGVAATSVSFSSIQGIALDSSGNLYIAVTMPGLVLKIDAAGTISVVAGSGTAMSGFSGDGGPATSALLNYPRSVAIDASGNLYIADSWNDRIRRVDASTSVISTIAGFGPPDSTHVWGSGDGGPATSAVFYPTSVSLDPVGNLYITDSGDRIRKVDSTGIITEVVDVSSLSGTWGGTGEGPGGIAIDPYGGIFIAATWADTVQFKDGGSSSTLAGKVGTAGYSGDGGPPTGALLNQPSAVAIDSFGNIYIADTGNNCIRRIGKN